MIIKLSKPQLAFVSAKEQFPAFVGGMGSGKTHAAIMRAIALKMKYYRQNVAYYLPTFDLCRTIAFPRFAEVLETMNIPHKINRSDAFVDFGPFGQIIFRTMDTPERIIGYEVADSVVDELDTLPTEKAREVWNKIIARNRQKKQDGALNSVAVATTPEGFRFVYEKWGKSPKPGYRLIKASTEVNKKYLPEGYIDTLTSNYPTSLLAAYRDGEFVNLNFGSVYHTFDRNLNFTNETIKVGEPLHIGMDFNVTKMASVVYVLRNDKPHAVMEHTGIFDTPDMVRILKERYQGHRIMVYPDASGKSRKSQNASESDIAQLRAAGFNVLTNPSNPAVKDRIAAMNKIIEVRDYRVNPDTCPELVEALEKQAYDKNGEPDKASGFDHVLDAAGYMVAYRYPVRKPMTTIKLVGL
jgi:phage terminase large subunit